MKGFERAELLAPARQGLEGRGQIRQVCPGVRHVERSRIGHPAAIGVFGNHLVEPAAASRAAVEVAGAQDDRAHSMDVGGFPEPPLRLDPDIALARRGALCGHFGEQFGHRPSVVVDVAGKQMHRAARTGRRDNGIGYIEDSRVPRRIGRIGRVHDDVGTFGRRNEVKRGPCVAFKDFDAGREHRIARRRAVSNERADLASPRRENSSATTRPSRPRAPTTRAVRVFAKCCIQLLLSARATSPGRLHDMRWARPERIEIGQK